MNTIDFVLKQKGTGYYFSNPKKDTENEIFHNKQDGVKILVDYLEEKIISVCKALELIDEITALRYFPITREVKAYQLAEDILSLSVIMKVKKDLQELSETETETDLPKFKICNCGKHGKIIGQDFVSLELTSKEAGGDAIEELFGDGKINRDEREKLKVQIEESTLPKKVSTRNPSLN
ncbi:MAG: hypothetical protein U0469_03255 [Candidatus Paceibacterota bacterium]|jgi:hypothetical protein